MRRDTRRTMAVVFAIVIVVAMLAAVIAPLIAAARQFGPVDPERWVTSFDDGPLPDTTEVTDAPPITGDVAADDRLRSLAEARGYRLRPLPDATTLVEVDGWLVHGPVAAAWVAMRDAAAADGVSLRLASGYRSVDAQRPVFLGHLDLSPATINAGTADAHIDHVLSYSAPPGYSKHHTGYAIDVSEGTERFARFHTTEAFTWLSRDHYANARRFGFVPSYPPGVGGLGPDAEAWEYVWVGDAALEPPAIGFAG